MQLTISQIWSNHWQNAAVFSIYPSRHAAGRTDTANYVYPCVVCTNERIPLCTLRNDDDAFHTRQLKLVEALKPPTEQQQHVNIRHQ